MDRGTLLIAAAAILCLVILATAIQRIAKRLRPDWRKNPHWVEISEGVGNPELFERIYSDFLKASINSSDPTSIEKCSRDTRHGPAHLASLIESKYGRFDKHTNASIARAFSHKLLTQKNIARQLNLGITHGIWRHSHAGNPMCPHLRLDGKRFSLKRGMREGFRFIYPGCDAGCLCGWSPIVSGFEDDQSQ